MEIIATNVETFIARKLYKFNASKELAWAWNAQENIILFGPGGYGKSDAAVIFGEYLKSIGAINSNPFTMCFGQGMTEEKLFGGIDIKKFQNSGEIEYLLRNSWIMHEYVIWDEIWDTNSAILLILKDALQSGYIRMGNQLVKIKTKMIVACTNRSREEVISDTSTEALFQRFLFEKEVKWDSHYPGDYSKAFSTATGMFDTINEYVANICAEVNSDEYTVSPRTAGKALKSARINGIKSLAGMHGFADAVKKWSDKKEKIEQEAELVQLFEGYATQCNILKKEFSNTNSFVKKAVCVKKIQRVGKTANDTAVTDRLVERRERFIEKCRNMVIELTKQAAQIIVNPKVNSFPYEFKQRVSNGNLSSALKLVKIIE